jgi:hydroxyacylglutathione hydrolase
MKIKIELEDTFADIVRKASRGTKTSLDALGERTGIDRSRLSQLLDETTLPTESEAASIASALELDPAKLTDSGLRRWYPNEPSLPKFVRQQINAPHPSNGYFLLLEDRKAGAFVDPAGLPVNIIDGFMRAHVELQYILVTHKHRDHADALAAVRNAFPKAITVIHPLDAAALGSAARGAQDAVDGGSLPFGDDHIRMLYTPGHTDGSTCFVYKGGIFTGDTMFAGSVGALFGEQFGYADLLHNVRTKILSLPEATIVYPGHGPVSTIAQERAHNPFFF